MSSKDILKQMADKINIGGKDEILKDSKKIQVTLSDAAPYYVVIGDAKVSLFDGTVENATSTIKSTDQILSDILTGKLNAFSAFMGGKVTVSGDLFYVQKLINSLTKAK
ncbi:MAG: SCP2 sterol-binding domain-containing protein [Thermoplasmata archaeon]